MVAEQTTYEIRWHGRGGQGAVTSSKILADAGYRSGFAGVTAAPSFGAMPPPADGTMVIETTRETPRGTSTSKLVFKKST